ncbi:mycothione reductase [Kribbella jiaozuonensis]|uniref:Mycothione reductase n=1 Tax=Kribbella jiaozuonensis TaxID=2575441 RepID=A0A4V5UY80_9ACTN|nr:mycothione reductase [Kribbella jiaozuonensis]TKK82383.1 mycothione reductase [Kribbella jiaozuonensis]
MRHHDVVVIGAGSGNMVIGDSFAGLDVAVVEERRFGGTCLNFGCIPSKMLAYAAEVADTVRGATRYDVDAELLGLRWTELRDRVFKRIDADEARGRAGREASDFVTVYPGHARFLGPRRLQIELGAESVSVEADQIVIAAGGRPLVPPPVAASGLPYETSDTIMRIDTPPRRLAILGGGYIAAEFAHVFAAAGSEIVIIEQADQLLGPQDESVAQAYTDLARHRFELHLGRELTKLDGEPGALLLHLDDGTTLTADALLVAVGRTPNSDKLELAEAGISTHDDGRIVVDKYQRTTVDGVYALGDVCSAYPLKHVANREAEVVAHNLRHPDDLRATDHEVVPAAVFTDPQVASVGSTEQDLRDAGRSYVAASTRFADVAYGWAMEDTTSFCKLLADRSTGRLLGAHIIGPQAATLIQPLVVAMALDIDTKTLAERPYWIHPALTEVVKETLRQLPA